MKQHEHEVDIIPTSAGDLRITFLGHGTLMLEFNGKIIHVDPYDQAADYAALPKADLVLITHEHGDHLSLPALERIRTHKTEVVINEAALAKVKDGIVMHNGEARGVQGIAIEAVPAYNVVHKRESGEPFHPKGAGNGYILTFGDTKVYIAGDTENIPEMKYLKDIDVAFLPMNLPYTMTPEMAAHAARSFHPRILYPYHYGSTHTALLVDLLKGEPIDVRIRRMS